MKRFPVAILIVILVSVSAANWLAPHNPTRTDAAVQLQPPSSTYLFGTDYLGRDVFSRVLYGGQRTLIVAGLATICAALFGVGFGLLAALSNKRVEQLLLALLNAVLALPSLLLALVLLTLLEKSWLTLALAVGLAQLPPLARVAWSIAASVRHAAYVEAARAQGATLRHIIWRHILPNSRAPLLAYIGVTFSYSILNAAGLSLLGLGGDVGAPDWGVMLADGRASFRNAPWVAFAPGVAISLTIFSVNALIDAYNARQA